MIGALAAVLGSGVMEAMGTAASSLSLLKGMGNGHHPLALRQGTGRPETAHGVS